MSRILWKSLLISPAVLSAGLLVSSGAIAAQNQTVKEVAQTQSVEAKSIQTPVVAVAAVPEAPATTSITTAGKAVANETKVAQATPAGTTQAEPVKTQNLDQILRYSKEGSGSNGADPKLGQVTNVSQFSDVQPTDWAYEALRNIVEKYGCLVGYPDGTYRGNRALSRYEFAAGLNHCLQQVEALIKAQGANAVSRTDFEALQRLVEEFRTELATIGTRVDNLEGRTKFLEEHQFSTTTKLGGEVIFAATDTFDKYPNETIFGDRVRLDLRTSFTGRDTLHTRLAAGNLAAFFPGTSVANSTSGSVTNNRNPITFEGNQTFNIAPDNANTVKLDWLGYYFPFGASKIYLTAQGGIHSDYAATTNPYFEDYDGGNGALSTFAQESPIYRLGGGSGGAISLGLGKGGVLRPTSLTVGYLASNGNDTFANGFVKGSYSALGQLNFNVGDRIGLAFTYSHGYTQPLTAPNGISDAVPGTVSANGLAAQPLFGMGRTSGQLGINGRPVVGTLQANYPSYIAGAPGQAVITNSYGVEAAIRPANFFSISGFVQETNARILKTGDANIWSYGAGVAFPNFGKQGNVLGFFAGVEPTLKGLRTNGTTTPLPFTRDNSYHIEGFYKYQLTDNISITPGVIYLTHPGQNDDTDNALIGTLRTTMTF